MSAPCLDNCLVTDGPCAGKSGWLDVKGRLTPLDLLGNGVTTDHCQVRSLRCSVHFVLLSMNINMNEKNNTNINNDNDF